MERRTEARMLCSHLVEVRWEDATGKPQRATAILEDISQWGAGLQLEARVPTGAAVRIRHAKGTLCGTARYGVFRETGYFVGVQFEPDSLWNRAEFEPEHFLDPAEIKEKFWRTGEP